MKKKLLLLITAAVMTVWLTGCSSDTETDYSDMDSWMRNDYENEERADADADVIFLTGTVSQYADQDNGVVRISDELKKGFKQHYPGRGEVFDDDTRMYVPYYRQISLDAAMGCEEHDNLPYLMRNTEVYSDICGFLDYYFENCNDGRPFILAGISQGGAGVQVALEGYFGEEKHKKYLDRLVAAYSIAYGVDKNWISENDYLRFAEGAKDTGVVISWVTEGPGEKGDSILLAGNPSDTMIINPINWKRDDTYADRKESLGTYEGGEIVTPGLYNLQYDPERGSLICDNNTQYNKGVWGGKSLHRFETQQAFMDVRENMHDRIEAFLEKKQ